MPLLGRHKSSSSSSAASQQQPQTAENSGTGGDRHSPRHPVCESPLFGLRRQLELGNRDGAAGQQPSRRSDSGEPQGGNPAPLSTVPQQITRQQIHYAFSIMDNNKDGMIDLGDLSQMLANLGVPIDEAILSHIMSSVSKRGDHRVSEDEFLQWISLFIQVNDQSPNTSGPARRTEAKPEVGSGTKSWRNYSLKSTPASSTSKGRGKAATSTSGSSTLVAQTGDVVPRNRRGSGSGLALMRSLSGSSVADHPQQQQQQESAASSSSSASESHLTDGGKQRAAKTRQQQQQQQQPQQQPSEQDVEARNDLRAAFCVFDLDGDGFITLDEVLSGLKLLGESWSPNELRQLFSKCNSSSQQSSSAASSDLSKQRISIDDFVQLLL